MSTVICCGSGQCRQNGCYHRKAHDPAHNCTEFGICPESPKHLEQLVRCTAKRHRAININAAIKRKGRYSKEGQ